MTDSSNPYSKPISLLDGQLGDRIGYVQPTPDQAVRKASLLVCSFARDVSDARELMYALGLIKKVM